MRVRMDRQRLVTTRPFELFIHEQALRLPVGGNRVMNEQLLKLVLIAEQPTITIRVVPTALGARSVHGGSFVLFRYRGHEPLIYLEQPRLGFFLDGRDHVSTFHEVLADLRAVALDERNSRQLLAALASEFDQPGDVAEDRVSA